MGRCEAGLDQRRVVTTSDRNSVLIKPEAACSLLDTRMAHE
jgi:hypothetical protein